MARTPNSLPLMQWEIEEAQYLREIGNTWRTIGEILRRDPSGLRKAAQRVSKLAARSVIHTIQRAAE